MIRFVCVISARGLNSVVNRLTTVNARSIACFVSLKAFKPQPLPCRRTSWVFGSVCQSGHACLPGVYLPLPPAMGCPGVPLPLLYPGKVGHRGIDARPLIHACHPLGLTSNDAIEKTAQRYTVLPERRLHGHVRGLWTNEEISDPAAEVCVVSLVSNK